MSKGGRRMVAMKWLLTILTFAFFGLNPCLPFPDELHEKQSQQVEDRRGRVQKMTPEEREAKRKELKERLQKRISELRARQTNATITPSEVRELQRREQILKRFAEEKRGAKPAGKPVVPGSTKD